MDKVKEDLFACPIYLQIPENEIYQCKNGHGICRDCLSKDISNCPQCREQYLPGTLVRNRPLEAILDAMTFDCTYKSKGCKEKLHRSKMSTHAREQCRFNKQGHLETISGGLKPGVRITIVGTPWSQPDRFQIEICEAPTSGKILLHFNPRFKEAYAKPDADVVVRNTAFQRGWGHEERHSPPFPFQKNVPFKLQLWCETNQFHVSVNGKSFIDYKYRLPLELGKYLKITGSLQIKSVVVSS